MIKFPLITNKTTQAILLGLSAFVLWACGDAGTKFVGKTDAPVIQIISLSSVAGMFIITLAAIARGGIKRLKPNNLKLQAFQATGSILTAIISVITFTQLPLTTVYTALFSSPLITIILGRCFIKDPTSKQQLLFVILGFVGSVIAVNPLSADLHSGSALGWILLPFYPLLFAANTLIMRTLSSTETSESIAFFPTAIRALFFLPLALFSWHPMTWPQTFIILGTGCTGGTAYVLISSALSKASSTIISPLHYSQLVIGATLGYLCWGDVPAWYTVAGAIIIVASGVAGARTASRGEHAAI